MQYQGGKSRIAGAITAKIRELHPTATKIWEPFCGGGAVTLALCKANFAVTASDTHPDLIMMYQAMLDGHMYVFGDVTEADYTAAKSLTFSTARRGFIGFGSSFGGGWFAGFARRKMCGGKPASIQPYQEAQRFIAKLKDACIGIAVSFHCQSYTSTPDHVLVYADPPYRGTKPYKGSPPFDHDAFWTWVRTRSGPTFVSELQGPDDIQVVWRKQHKSQNASNSPTTKATSKVIEREERLYYKPATVKA